MLVTAVTLVVWLAGAPLAVVAVAAVAVASPPLALMLAIPAAIVWVSRRWAGSSVEVDEAVFCAAMAAELHAGASLRHALAAAAERDSAPALAALAAPARAAVAGVPASQIASGLERALPVNGRHAALAFQLAAETGSGGAAVFTRLATRATQAAESKRERDAFTAQARFSAVVVGGAPIMIVVLLLGTGRLGVMRDAGTVGIAIMVCGLSLIGAGLIVVWALVRRTAA